VFSQQYDKNWLLSYNGGSPSLGNYRLIFRWTPSLQVDSMYSLINIFYSNVTMSNRNGDYLFASNGGSIYDNSGQLMQNGSNINMSPCSTAYAYGGSPIAQSIICLPQPNDTNSYYLFHGPCNLNTPNYAPTELLYSIIDMGGNNGLGAVTSKNINLFNDSLAFGQMTACKHSDGNSWWIFIPRTNSNIYHRILFSQNGIVQHDTIQSVHIHNAQEIGRAVFSQDGKYYARNTFSTGLSIMEFDRCLGRLNEIFYKDKADFPLNTYVGSVEFSPNSKILYFMGNSFILQYDLRSTNILSTETNVANLSPIRCANNLQNSLSWGQLAPDGKIYITSTAGIACVNYIEYPDSIGISCNVIQRGLTLPMYIAGYSTFPNNPNYNLGPDGQDCAINSIPIFPLVSDVQVFPNPASTKIFLSGENVKNFNLELYSIEGELVLSKCNMTSNESIDISTLPDGFYFAAVRAKNESFFKRLVIAH
jgi:hypothetical protein